MLFTEIAILDELLQDHSRQLGADFTAYRNHTYRVVNLGVALSPEHPGRLGLRTFGLPRRLIREILSTWPGAGFHKRLVQLELSRLRTHPWSPLPMMKL